LAKPVEGFVKRCYGQDVGKPPHRRLPPSLKGHDNMQERKRRRIQPGTFGQLIRDYMQSPQFAKLAKNTQSNYRREFGLRELPDLLGDYPAKEMRPLSERYWA